MEIREQKTVITMNLVLLSVFLSWISLYSSDSFVQGQHPRLGEKSHVRYLSRHLLSDIVDLTDGPVAIINTHAMPVYIRITDVGGSDHSLLWDRTLSAVGNQDPYEIESSQELIKLPSHKIRITVYRMDSDSETKYYQGSIDLDAKEVARLVRIEIMNANALTLFYADGSKRQATVKDNRKW